MEELHKREGFTLIELVLVIALIGILSVYALPRIVPQSQAGLFGASRKIRSDLRYAQSLSMNRGVVHGIDFAAGGPYVLYREDPANPVLDPQTQQPFSEDFEEYQGTSVTTAVRVEFDTMGRPTLGADTPIKLENGGDLRNVMVSANTGHVVIE